MHIKAHLDKPRLHHNITIRKALYFGVTAGIGAGITWLLTWALTEFAEMWYMSSVVIASSVAIVAKFIITAIWVFNDKQDS